MFIVYFEAIELRNKEKKVSILIEVFVYSAASPLGMQWLVMAVLACVCVFGRTLPCDPARLQAPPSDVLFAQYYSYLIREKKIFR